MRGFTNRRNAGLLALAFLFTACPQLLRAQAPAGTAVSPAVHAQRIAGLKELLAGCMAQPSQCDPNRTGPDEIVQLDSRTATRVRFEWLRDGLRRMGKETGASRTRLAEDLAAHLVRMEDAGSAVPTGAVQQAREQFDQVLAAREFAPDREPTWLERKWQEFVEWLGSVLLKGFQAASKAPGWLRIFFEFLLFLIPALLLLLWLMRQVREDRLRPSAGGDEPGRAALAPDTEWRALAEQCAAAGDWRLAIHALYWATIAGFEARRLWQPNRTRTPREYMRLLALGSDAHAALAEQTRLFELTWYGYRDATQEDYRRAAALHAATEAR